MNSICLHLCFRRKPWCLLWQCLATMTLLLPMAGWKRGKRDTVSSGRLCVARQPRCQRTWSLSGLPELTAGYLPADIYNADETGLYYCALPERSMVVRGDPRKGIKTSKERVTVLLACSAAGEKLKPLLIGKSVKPWCFKGIDKVALPVTYRANRKAWMTGILFKEWLDKLNNSMKVQGRNILLFVDNYAARHTRAWRCRMSRWCSCHRTPHLACSRVMPESSLPSKRIIASAWCDMFCQKWMTHRQPLNWASALTFLTPFDGCTWRGPVYQTQQ